MQLFLLNNMGVAATIILVEDLCQPNLIKAVKKVVRCNVPGRMLLHMVESSDR